jgi:membrane-associated phospholipid phosphatase
MSGPLITLAIIVLMCNVSYAQNADEPQPQSQASLALPDAPSSLIAPIDRSSQENKDSSSVPDETDSRVTVLGLPGRIVSDQLRFVTSPAHIKKNDLKWFLPLAGATALAFTRDEKTMDEVVSTRPAFNQANQNFSDIARYGFIFSPVALFGAGELTHNDHVRETGLLGGEAVIDATIASYVVKICFDRERPGVDKAEGKFFSASSRSDSSFISGHSIESWSSAAVLAAEYPSLWKQVGIYTLATGVSLTRVLGQEHFPSDVLLGSASGWLIGHYVYRAHHRHRTH